MMRVPVSTVLSWPPADILAWKSVFDVFGPLDFERDDWRDARDVYSRCAKKGDRIEEFLLYRPTAPALTPAEENVRQLREDLREVAAVGGEAAADTVRAMIRHVKREAFSYEGANEREGEGIPDEDKD